MGYKDKIQAYIHASHAPILAALSLEQLNFISDLYKTQSNINQETAHGSNNQFPNILNEQQLKLFYSLPTQVQKNLKTNYCLKASLTTQLSVNSSRFSCLRAFYDRYENKQMMRFAKIAAKTGMAYWLIKQIATGKDIKDMRAALVISKLLKHKKRFILGIAALVALQEKHGPTISTATARRMPKLCHLARRFKASVTPSLFKILVPEQNFMNGTRTS